MGREEKEIIQRYSSMNNISFLEFLHCLLPLLSWNKCYIPNIVDDHCYWIRTQLSCCRVFHRYTVSIIDKQKATSGMTFNPKKMRCEQCALPVWEEDTVCSRKLRKVFITVWKRGCTSGEGQFERLEARDATLIFMFSQAHFSVPQGQERTQELFSLLTKL